MPPRALGGRCQRRKVMLARKGCGIGHRGSTVGWLFASGGGHEPHLLHSVTDPCSKAVARSGTRGGDATGVWALSVSDSVSAFVSSRGDDGHQQRGLAVGAVVARRAWSRLRGLAYPITPCPRASPSPVFSRTRTHMCVFSHTNASLQADVCGGTHACFRTHTCVFVHRTVHTDVYVCVCVCPHTDICFFAHRCTHVCFQHIRMCVNTQIRGCS